VHSIYICWAHFKHMNNSSLVFLLDFGARYAVDRCGSEDTNLIAVMSLLTICATWVWLVGFVMGFFRVELYISVAKHTLLLLTLVQGTMLVGFNVPPPVQGCGPEQSFPSPQVTISAYALAVYMFYHGKFKSRDYTLNHIMTLQLICVVYSVLWLGFASPPSCFAGVALGVCVAAILHTSMTQVYQDPDLVTQLTRILSGNPLTTKECTLPGLVCTSKLGSG
jgi:hypothetical protein